MLIFIYVHIFIYIYIYIFFLRYKWKIAKNPFLVCCAIFLAHVGVAYTVYLFPFCLSGHGKKCP